MVKQMRYFRIIFALLLAAVPAIGFAAEESNQDANLAEVKKQMSLMSTFSANFNQTKHFKILSSDIYIKGSIYIRKKPFSLAWIMDAPMRYKVIMTDNYLLQWDEESGNVKEYKFGDNPMLNMISRIYHDILIGDFTQISGESKITVDTTEFTIDIIPISGSEMSKAISKITFKFSENFRYLVHISIIEPEGNSTTIDFFDVNMNESIPAKVWLIGNDS